MSQPAPTDVRPISNSTLTPADSVGAPVNSGGFLGAPTPLNNGVLESSEPAAAAATAPAAGATPTAPVTAPGSIQGNVAPAAATAAAAGAVAASSSATSSASGNFVVQVGAVSDQTRAQQYQQRLSQQFSVPGGSCKTARSGVFSWVPLLIKHRPAPCSSACKAKRSCSPLLLAPTKRRGPPVHLAHVKVINKLMRNVGCWPAEHLL